MSGTELKRTLGWMMITLGFLFFILRTPLPYDLVMPGVTSALLGVVILMIGKRPRTIY
jgi:hypothetical protein